MADASLNKLTYGFQPRIRLGLLALLFLLNGTAFAAQPNGSLAGKLLVATPAMTDPRFVETVIYLVKHDEQGAMGLVINRPWAKGTIEDLLEGFGIKNSEVRGEIIIHYGGPVSPRSGFVLHSEEVLLEGSTAVKNGVAMTADAKLIEMIGMGKGPRQWLFAFGYAGWAPGQLEAELHADAWYVVNADKDLIFAKDADKKWQRAVDKRQVPL